MPRSRWKIICKFSNTKEHLGLPLSSTSSSKQEQEEKQKMGAASSTSSASRPRRAVFIRRDGLFADYLTGSHLSEKQLDNMRRAELALRRFLYEALLQIILVGEPEEHDDRRLSSTPVINRRPIFAPASSSSHSTATTSSTCSSSPGPSR